MTSPVSAVGGDPILASGWDHRHEAHGLLVLVGPDGQRLRPPALPFRDVTVIGVGTARAGDLVGEFDVVVVSPGAPDASAFDAIVRTLLPALRPGGHVMVMLPAWRGAANTRTAEATLELEGLTWRGLDRLDGRPCAVMRRTVAADKRPGAAGLLLATASAACHLALADPTLCDRGVDDVTTVAVRGFEARRRSEQALLRHLDTLVQALEDERRHRGARLVLTALAHRRVGRALLRLLAPLHLRLRGVQHQTQSQQPAYGPDAG
jgi:hypothetical protein